MPAKPDLRIPEMKKTQLNTKLFLKACNKNLREFTFSEFFHLGKDYSRNFSCAFIFLYYLLISVI